MQNVLDYLRNIPSDQLIRIITPVVVLAGGWLLALLIRQLVRAGLSKITWDEKLAVFLLGAEKAKKLDTNVWIARGVYYVVMVGVLVAFLQTLGLTAATTPLNAFLEKIFAFVPNIVAGLGLGLLAWVVATLLRMILRRTLEKAQIDKKIADEAGDGSPTVSVATSIADTVYWLTFLLFLPAILGALGMTGLLVPIQGLVGKVLDFLPQLLSAGVLLVVGWFAATILQRIVTNLLVSAGADRFGTRLGLDGKGDARPLSQIIGLLVKVLVLIPVVIAALNALAIDALTQPASQMLEVTLKAIPTIIGACALLLAAYVGGKIVGALVESLLASAGFDRVLVTLGLAEPDSELGLKPSKIAGKIVLVAILALASMNAANMLEFTAFAAIVSDFTAIGVRILIGLVIFGIGLYLANITARTLRNSSVTHAKILSIVARVSIILFAGAMSLRQMGLANEIIELGFGLVVGAFAVAAAVAFGIGGREVAAEIIREGRDKLKRGAAEK